MAAAPGLTRCGARISRRDEPIAHREPLPIVARMRSTDTRPRYFRQVRVDSELCTVCWPNGADIAPETLRDALSDLTRKNARRGGTSSPVRPAPGTNGAIPEICRFFGVVIQMYFSEKHAPHFHVRYEGKRASIDIRTLGISPGVCHRGCWAL